MKYKNLARAEAQDAELEALEAEYRKQQGDPGLEPVAREEDPVQNVLTQEEETWKQRYGNLKSFSDKRYNELVQKVTALEQANALASKRPAELPRNVDEMREWVKTYPDLAGVIKAMIAEDVDYMREQISPQLQELEDVKYELVRQKAYAAVVRAHNDFPELLNDQEFKSRTLRNLLNVSLTPQRGKLYSRLLLALLTRYLVPLAVNAHGLNLK
jgi:hypothetical protein